MMFWMGVLVGAVTMPAVMSIAWFFIVTRSEHAAEHLTYRSRLWDDNE